MSQCGMDSSFIIYQPQARLRTNGLRRGRPTHAHTDVSINRRFTQINADEFLTLFATDPHRHTQTFIFFYPNDLFGQNRQSLRDKLISIISRFRHL
jgi:hypothetical protein